MHTLRRLNDFEDNIGRVIDECYNECGMCPQYLFDARCGTVPNSQPDNLRQCTEEGAHVVEVIISGHNRVPIGTRERPDFQVTRLIKPMKDNMAAFGKQIGDPCHQFARQVVITAFLTEVEPG